MSIANTKKFYQSPEIMKRFDFIEAYNCCESVASNTGAARLAAKYKKVTTGGSDSHRTGCVGRAYTILPEPVTCETELISMIHKKVPFEVGGVQYEKTTKDRIGKVNKVLVYSFWFYNKGGELIKRRGKKSENGRGASDRSDRSDRVVLHGKGMMAVLLKVVLLLLFVRITVSDWRTHKIPDQWNMAMCLLALLLAMTDASVSWQERVMGIFAVSIPMAVIVFFVPGSFGGGDIKFVAAVGAALGVQTVVAGSMAAILFAGGYCVYLLRERKGGGRHHLPSARFYVWV